MRYRLYQEDPMPTTPATAESVAVRIDNATKTYTWTTPDDNVTSPVFEP